MLHCWLYSIFYQTINASIAGNQTIPVFPPALSVKARRRPLHSNVGRCTDYRKARDDGLALSWPRLRGTTAATGSGLQLHVVGPIFAH